MHPLRVLLLISLAVGAAFAWWFGAALEAGGMSAPGAVTLGLLSFLAFLAPWGAVYLWMLRRAAHLDEIIDRARAIAAGQFEASLAARTYHAEMDDLARAVEGLRGTLARQREAHEEQQATMHEIVESLGEGLLGVSADGRVAVANRRVAEMFGVSQPALIGRRVVEAVRKQSVVAAIDRALRGERSTDRVSYAPGDADRQIEVRAFPVEASREIAAVALFIDVTTIERLQRVRQDFLDDFSHEVRTPLAGLRSAAETLEHGGVTREHEVQLRNIMQRQITRIDRLVNDLAELTRIESGEVVLRRRNVNLRELVEELTEDFHHERDETLRIEVRGEDVIAFIDPDRTLQIVTNLLDNAWKHGGGGPIDIDVVREDRAAVVRVSDVGPGIPAGELDRIFNRFYRVDRSRSQPGTGLGLAIAKHLAVAHGGSVRATNRAGGGATFELSLPLELP